MKKAKTCMMYYAQVHQPGGCDYTINCGTDIINLNAETFEGARDELKKQIKKNYTGERSLDEVTIFEVTEAQVIDVEEIYQEIDDEKKGAKKRMEEASEREEYERLKKKYG